MLSTISTLALRETVYSSMAKAQARLEATSAEVSSGRHHDVGVALGSTTSRTIDMRAVVSQLETIEQTNGMARTRLEATQSALSQMADLADGFFKSIAAFRQGNGDRTLLISDAKSRLGAMEDLLATTSGGVAVFGGINTSQSPFADYIATPPSAGRTAIEATFAAEFGFAPDDPSVSSISSSQMDSYLQGVFADNFADPAWQTNFSTASDLAIRDRISLTDVIETPITANNAGIRKFISALVAVIDSGTERLNGDAFEKLADSMTATISNASIALAQAQSVVGISQERVAKADDRLSGQKMLLERNISTLESVDITEASTRLNQLTINLQTSYAVTARLQNLSILNYL